MKQKKVLLRIIGVSLVLLLASCIAGPLGSCSQPLQRDGTVSPLATLEYDPHSHDFGNQLTGETIVTTFEIWRGGGCCSITYQLAEACPWLEVYPTSGTSNGEHDVITVTIHTAGLELGLHSANIQITSNGGNGVFAVTVTIVDHTNPAMSYNPHSYDFGDRVQGRTYTTTFDIWNNGDGLLTYSLSESCDWMSVNPTSGTADTEHDIITVSIDTTNLDLGPHSSEVSITSNNGNGLFTISVNIVENPLPSLSYSPQSYDFGDQPAGGLYSTTFHIWNSGDGVLSYNLNSQESWLEVYPTGGTSSGEQDPITVSVNTEGLEPGPYTGEVLITSNGGNGVFTVTINVIGQNPPELEISSIKGGQGITAEITNIGSSDATFVDWSIVISGGFIVKLRHKSGTEDVLPAGASLTVRFITYGYSLGLLFRPPRITVSAVSAEGAYASKTVSAKIVGPLVTII